MVSNEAIANIIFLAASIFGGFTLFKSLRLNIESINWPETTGIVLQKNIESDDTFVPNISYRYTVGSKEYIGSRINFDFLVGYNTRQKAENYIADYSENSEVRVKYNPDDPNIAVLETGVTGHLFIRFSIAFTFLIFVFVSCAYTLLKLISRA